MVIHKSYQRVDNFMHQLVEKGCISFLIVL